MKTNSTLFPIPPSARVMLFSFLAMVFGFVSQAQLSLSTVPPLNGGNGAGGISFNVTAVNAINVTGLSCSIYGSASGPFEIWYRPTAINGAPTVNTANGWELVASGTVTPGGTGTTNNPPVVLPGSFNVPMPAGATYGFFINTFSSSPNCAYTTWNAANQETFTDGNITIFTGTNVGYGGPGPNPTNHPRQFNGSVQYSLASQAPNDGGVTEILQPISYCSGETVPLVATIRNFGTEQLDSCLVVWDVNGTLDSAWFDVALDTFSGTGNIDTTIFLDSITPGTGALNLHVYTKWPNGVADTVNGNDTSSLYIAGPALSGTYVIGSSSGADFPSFTLAAAALNSAGVCGAVIMEVESGTYDEQWSLDEILGASSVNTITFRSQNNDSTDVILTTSAASATMPSIVALNGSDWVRFEKLGFENTSVFYDHAINLSNGADSNIITNCRFVGNYQSTSSNASLIASTGGNDNGLVIQNNRFEGGGYAVYLYGGSTTSLEGGLVLANNELINQYYHAVRLYYQNAPMVKNNYVTSNSSYSTGAAFYMVYCDNAMEVSGNHVVTDPTSPNPWPYYGMYISLCDGGGIANAGKVFNNRIIVGVDTNTASSSTFYGLYMTSTNAMRVVNNSITALNGGSSARALYQSASDLIYFKNNLFTSYSTGHAAYYNSGISVEVDRNNYYAPNGAEIYYAGSSYEVADFSAATGYDINSLSVDPMWSDIYQAYLCNAELDGIASTISYVTTDYSGLARGSNPDPGAVEFVAVSNFSLGGNDTICGNEASFEISGATSGLTWSVNGTTSNNNLLMLTNNGTTPQTLNVLVSFASGTGCGSASDNILVTLVPNADLDSNTHLCADETVVLQPGGGNQATYFWTPVGTTTNSLAVSSPGLVTVTKTELGCVSSSTTVITQSEGVALLDVEICADDMPYTANASIANGTTYAWSGGTAPSSAVNTFTEAGSYQVSATDVFGCLSSDTLTVAVIDEPVANIAHSHVANFYSFSSGASQFVGSNATYNWNFGDGNFSSDPNPQHAYAWTSTPTTYTVTLSIINDCGSDQTSTVVGVDPLGVAESGAIKVAVFPNPANDVVQLTTSQILNDTEVSITDLTGRLIMNTQLGQWQQHTLDVSMIASGTYVLNIRSTEGITSHTLVIQ